MANQNEDRMKSLELAIAKVNKDYGKGAVAYGNTDYEPEPAIPTGNFKLDLALGIGGLPKGRIVEIFGGEALGKSLLALNLVANVQAEGGNVLYVDAEHDLDPDWMQKIGVDVEKMLLHQPEYGEQGLQVALDLMKTGALDLIVIDSVAALTPKAELDGDIEDNHIGLQARMLAQALRSMRHEASRTGTCLVFINQIRDKIGFMQSGTTSPGGRALKFYASVRIELKNIGAVKEKGENVGTRVKAMVIKSKVSRPHRYAEYDVVHGKGFNNFGSILEMAIQYKLVIQKGAYYYLSDNLDKAFGHGEAAAIEYLASDMELTQLLQKQIIEIYRNNK